MNGSSKCGGNDDGNITNWYDFGHLCPKNPLDLIANAQISAVAGVFTNSSNFSTPPTSWITSTFSITSSPLCVAPGSDNI